MTEKINKYYTRVLQVSAAVLTLVLFWFAFIYYPHLVTSFKLGKNLPIAPVFKPVVASSYQFPIKTNAYTIEERDSRDYYVFVNGKTLQEFEFNRDNARLALKSALSMTDLCGLTVIYISSEGISTTGARLQGC